VQKETVVSVASGADIARDADVAGVCFQNVGSVVQHHHCRRVGGVHAADKWPAWLETTRAEALHLDFPLIARHPQRVATRNAHGVLPIEVVISAVHEFDRWVVFQRVCAEGNKRHKGVCVARSI